MDGKNKRRKTLRALVSGASAHLSKCYKFFAAPCQWIRISNEFDAVEFYRINEIVQRQQFSEWANERTERRESIKRCCVRHEFLYGTKKNSIMIKQSFKSYTNISGVAALEWRAASVSIAMLNNPHPTLFQINSIHCGRQRVSEREFPFCRFRICFNLFIKISIDFIHHSSLSPYGPLCRHRRRYCRCRCIILPPHSRHHGTFIRWRYFHFRL